MQKRENSSPATPNQDSECYQKEDILAHTSVVNAIFNPGVISNKAPVHVPMDSADQLVITVFHLQVHCSPQIQRFKDSKIQNALLFHILL